VKEKDLETLAEAVKKENERLQALRRSDMLRVSVFWIYLQILIILFIINSVSVAETSLDTANNVDGLDWDRIAERVRLSCFGNLP
jgi:hypothetical protein